MHRTGQVGLRGAGSVRVGPSRVVEGLGMHWDSAWLKKERPSGAAWGRFGEWVQQGRVGPVRGRLGLLQFVNCSKTRPWLQG